MKVIETKNGTTIYQSPQGWYVVYKPNHGCGQGPEISGFTGLPAARQFCANTKER